jgi:hypothetical protein
MSRRPKKEIEASDESQSPRSDRLTPSEIDSLRKDYYAAHEQLVELHRATPNT